MRSFLSRVELYTPVPELRVPEYTRTKVSWPTKGSFMILKASAEKAALASGSRVSCCCVSGLMAEMGGTSSGEGR